MGVSLLEENGGRRRPAIVPLTVEQFHRMMETGVLREGEPIELVDGILVYRDRGDSQGGKMHGPIHAHIAGCKWSQSASHSERSSG